MRQFSGADWDTGRQGNSAKLGINHDPLSVFAQKDFEDDMSGGRLRGADVAPPQRNTTRLKADRPSRSNGNDRELHATKTLSSERPLEQNQGIASAGVIVPVVFPP